MKKRIISVLLSAAIAFAAVPIPVSAVSVLRLTPDSVTAELKAGAEVTVPIRAEENPGFAAGTVDLHWDSTALTLKSVAYSESAPANSPPETNSPDSCKLCFGDYLAEENFTDTGVFFTVTFTIAEDAVPGEYALTLSGSDIVDAELRDVPTALGFGIVTLIGDAPADENALIIEIGNAEVSADTQETLKIPVTAIQNPGFAAGIADLLWDPAVFTLKEVRFTDTAPDNSSAPITDTGRYRISFGSYTAETDEISVGVLFTLVFDMNSSAEPGEYRLSFANTDVLNAALEDVPVRVHTGTVLLYDPSQTTETTGTEPAESDTTAESTTTETSLTEVDDSDTTTESTTIETILTETDDSDTTAELATTETILTVTNDSNSTAESTTTETTFTETEHLDTTTDNTTDETARTDVDDSDTTAESTKTETTITEPNDSAITTESTATETTPTDTDDSDTTTENTSDESTRTDVDDSCTTAELTTTETTLTETDESDTTTESTTTETTAETTVPPSSQIYDINQDGEVTISDAVLLIRFITEDGTLTQKQQSVILSGNPDLNGDAVVNLTDVRILLNDLKQA